MNIFILDTNPVRCAQAHCDKHVVKMILETAQLLSTTNHEMQARPPAGIYRPTHVNHPCAIWVRESSWNYKWLLELGFALCDEYTHRYGKVHKSRAVMELMRKTPRTLPTIGKTPWAQAMPTQYRRPNAVTAYRAYYSGEKSRMLKYTNRQPPSWLNLNQGE